MEEQMEIEALRAILAESFDYNQESGEISIEVVPSFGGAFENHCSIKLITKFPKNYPTTPIQYVEIHPTKGNFQPYVLLYLKNKFLNEAKNLTGEPMLYQLLEKLKEDLEYYNDEFREGMLIVFSEEILLNILQYLTAHDLAALAMVNKSFKRVSEDDVLWKEICNTCFSSKAFARWETREGSSHASTQDTLPCPFWKDAYLTEYTLRRESFEFLGIVLGRTGTGDDWPLHGSWKTQFCNEMYARSYQIIGTKIEYTFSGSVVGHCKMQDWSDAADAQFKQEEWYSSLQTVIQRCPYYSSPVGYILWNVKSKPNTQLMLAMLKSIRGIIVRCDSPSKYVVCSVESDVPCGYLINADNRFLDDQVELLVESVAAKKPHIKYLKHIISQLNTAMAKLPDIKVGQTAVKLYMKDYDTTGKRSVFYIPDLQEDRITPQIKKMLQTTVKLWVYNSRAIYVVYS